MDLSPGDRVDRYEVLALLGSGGMGEVYRARDPKLARLVALKILRGDGGAGTDGAARILREARAAAALSHANVLAVFDVGAVQEPEALRGVAYIAMELVVGRSLRSYIGDASVPLERRVSWLVDVARALGAAHQAGIVHRDVKPENVMIRSDGAVKVLDFGIARRLLTSGLASTEGTSAPPASSEVDGAAPERALETLTEQGQIIGTPYYMAPEQLRAEALDGRADQFAWGVVAYELLTGVPPWQREGANPLVTVSEILSLDLRPPAEVEPGIPQGLSDAILRALAKRRRDRFPTMGGAARGAGGAARAAEARAAAALAGRGRDGSIDRAERSERAGDRDARGGDADAGAGAAAGRRGGEGGPGTGEGEGAENARTSARGGRRRARGVGARGRDRGAGASARAEAGAERDGPGGVHEPVVRGEPRRGAVGLSGVGSRVRGDRVGGLHGLLRAGGSDGGGYGLVRRDVSGEGAGDGGKRAGEHEWDGFRPEGDCGGGQHID